ncbi:MAG: glycosyltransferase family 2 protein [Nitrospirota bacterium]|nr:MAG: glycosyltransferase family 2 protein [Nitrospirota bacterium]
MTRHVTKDRSSEVPELYIVIVNWNNSSDTIECISSLFEEGYKKRIVLVDNGSTDGSIDNISAWAGSNNIDLQILNAEEALAGRDDFVVTIISSPVNLGFAGANNLGIRYSIVQGAEFVLLLNNDTVVEKDVLSGMVRTVMSTKDTGIVGGKIRYYDNREKVWFSGGYISTVRGAFYHKEDDCDGIRETEFVTGCMMLIPADVIEKVGYLKEDYFLNIEDIDYSTRVRNAGLKMIVDCSVTIYHKYSATIGGRYSKMNQYYFHRNRMIYFSSNLDDLNKYIFYLFQFFFAIPVWLVVQLVKGRMQAIKGAILGYLDFFKGRKGKCLHTI